MEVPHVERRETISASERYERAAREWDERGRPEPMADPWNTMVLSCWIGSPGATRNGVSQCLRDYLAVHRRVLDRRNPDWFDDVIDGREHCTYCGRSWRAENCGICTRCSRTYPPCCGDKRGFVPLPNGNKGCPACDAGEIVG